MPVSRRSLLAAAALAPVAFRSARAESPLLRRPIPSSGEMLPAIGIGTSRRYEVEPTPEAVKPLQEAVETFLRLGGSVIDTAPSYGTAEDVLGLILSQGDLRKKVFLATKVDRSSPDETKAQVARSLERLRTDSLDLVAVHNLIDTASNLRVLRDLKAAKTIRYVGVTGLEGQPVRRAGAGDAHRAPRLHPSELRHRQPGRGRAHPAARGGEGHRGDVNVPFGRDRLFKAVQGKELPPVAKAIGCQSWPQFFLKYVLGHQAVTCPIPEWPRRLTSRTTSAPPTTRCPMPASASRWRA